MRKAVLDELMVDDSFSVFSLGGLSPFVIPHSFCYVNNLGEYSES